MRHTRVDALVRLAAVFAMLAGAACAPTLKQVTAEQLASLNAEQRATLDPVNNAHAEAVDALAKRRFEADSAKRALDIARHEQVMAGEAFAIAKLRIESAIAADDEAGVTEARAKAGEAQHGVQVADLEVTYREAALQDAEARVDEAAARLDLAVAKRESARFEAVADAQALPETVRGEERSGYLAQLARAEKGLAEASRTVITAESLKEQAAARLDKMQRTPPTPYVDDAAKAAAAP